MRLSSIQKRILNEHKQQELDYYNSMLPKDKISYSKYLANHKDENPSPSYWFNNLKKKDNVMEDFVYKIMGFNSLVEYKGLEPYDRHHYYVYLYRKADWGFKNTLLSPREWVRTREENKLNMDFTEIGRKMNLDDETVRKIYHEAIRKIKVFIQKNPRFKELEEYL